VTIVRNRKAMGMTGSPSVLIVEDERILAQSLAHLLGGKGWRAEVCHDGSQALERSRKTTFDVVVADWGVPGVWGSRLIEQLKGINPRCRVVVMSADPFGPQEHETVRALHIPCLPKPFSLDTLLLNMQGAEPTAA
jgi:DNA-binding response OmpR family regulator